MDEVLDIISATCLKHRDSGEASTMREARLIVSALKENGYTLVKTPSMNDSGNKSDNEGESFVKHNGKFYRKIGGKVNSGDLVRLKDTGKIFTLGKRSENKHNLWFSDDYMYRSVGRWEFDKLQELWI